MQKYVLYKEKATVDQNNVYRGVTKSSIFVWRGPVNAETITKKINCSLMWWFGDEKSIGTSTSVLNVYVTHTHKLK
jgi:hypothetical protein